MKTSNKTLAVILLFTWSYAVSSTVNSGTISGTSANIHPQESESSSPHSLREPQKKIKEPEYDLPVTRPSNSLIPTSLLKGFFMNKSKKGSVNHLTLMLAFSEESEYGTSILTENNPLLNMWTVDIYNSHLGGAITEIIEEKPVINSEFEEFSIDLNQGVSGLAPDWRNVLRFKIATEQKVDCKVSRDAFNKVIIDISWKDEQEFLEVPEESDWVSKLTFWK